MLDAAVQALGIISDPERLLFLALGVLIGLTLGVIPGLGGLVGLALLLPFTFDMNPYTAMALMMGLIAVTTTSDTIPAVLFGVPGTVGSAATILDGFPMAKKGEAGRAFGAAFSASLIGGLFGACLLAFSVPILRPVMLYIGSPELLSFCVFGLSLVAVLSRGAAFKGLAGASLGLLMKTTGDDPQTGTLRWTFDTIYLWDGIPIVPVALGLFAIPELCDMAIARTTIVKGDMKMDHRADQWQGVKDVFSNKFLVLRCSIIGSGLGAVPGIGASVIDWIAYGHAARSEKGADVTFGTGDVRGVIASEASNNAKEGGALVPTIAFGVPGTAAMALVLGAFLIHGLVPGPEMLTKRLDITYTLVWSVALANILGTSICFMFANQLAKIALVRIGILAPVVLAVVFVGAFQGSNSWGDMYVLLIIGAFGWIMKRTGWPRPPLVLGFVLGGLVERYMFISVERYGAEWMWLWREGSFKPLVTIIFAITLYGVLRPLIRNFRPSKGGGRKRLSISARNLNPGTLFTALIMAIFIAALVVSWDWEFGAKLVPHVICWAGLFFTSVLLIFNLFQAPPAPAVEGGPPVEEEPDTQIFDITVDFGDLPPRTILARAAVYFGWCIFFFIVAAVFGFLPALFIFLVAYIRLEGKESWSSTLAIAVPMGIFCYGLFHEVLHVPWPQTMIGDAFPALRAWLPIW